jgi:chromosome segregation ATPase
MSESSTLFNRIGNWFKRGRDDTSLPITGELTPPEHGEAQQPRSSFLRPFTRQNESLKLEVQRGFGALADLMTTIRENLEQQSRRQEELLEHLAHLPRAIESTTESSRVQSETLRAIHQQIEHQSGQQRQLAEILERISHTGGDQKEILDVLKDRVESLSDHDRVISDTLGSVSNAMQTMGKTSATSAEVMAQMRDQAAARDVTLEKMLAKQNTRFTTMLAVAILMSIAALVAVSVIGYLMWRAQQ